MLNEDLYSLKKQINKLEEISSKISYLINKDKFNQIGDLDKIRKKIIKDIIKKNIKFSENEKKDVVKLISKNNQIISTLNTKKSQELSKIAHSKKCSQAYYNNF